MNTTNESAEILNDLVQINNDRIEGYEKAIENLKNGDSDLRSVFVAQIGISQQCKLDLSTQLNVLKANTDQGTTASGKIYRAWMDVKAVFTGHDRKSILENCEFGEDAAQKAYKDAIKDDDLPANLKELVIKQKDRLKESHDKIKLLRDQLA